MTKSALQWCLGVLLGATVAGTAQAQDAPAPNSLIEPSQYLNTVGSTATALPRWEASTSFLLLQPSSGNLQYGTLVSPLPLPTPNWSNQSVAPDFTPAFNLGLSSRLNDAGADLQLTWTHLRTSDSASVAGNPNQFVGPPYEIGPDASLFSIAQATAQFRYDSVNLSLGQLFFADGPVQVRVFGGLQGALLSQDLSASFQSTDGLLANANTTDSVFTGVGPRLGMQAQCLAGNFDFLGQIAGAALIGRMHSRIDFYAVSPELANLGITPPNTQALTSPDTTQVVPSIDSKLAVGYSFPVGNNGLFRLEAGYQAAVYMNAVSQYSLTGVTLPPFDQSVGVFLRTATPLQSNFVVHGPSLTASWVF